MEALFVAADYLDDMELNSSYYRCLVPQKYLKLAGHDVRVTSGNSITFTGAKSTTKRGNTPPTVNEAPEAIAACIGLA